MFIDIVTFYTVKALDVLQNYFYLDYLKINRMATRAQKKKKKTVVE